MEGPLGKLLPNIAALVEADAVQVMQVAVEWELVTQLVSSFQYAEHLAKQIIF